MIALTLSFCFLHGVLCNVQKRNPLSYIPGDLTVRENGLILSTGLRSKVIAESGKKVRLTSIGSRSNDGFLPRPDGAACFPFPDGDGWVYAINSEEENKNGGVGAIYFDKRGKVTDYKMVLSKTSRNCSGGKTYWNTWVSCEVRIENFKRIA